MFLISELVEGGVSGVLKFLYSVRFLRRNLVTHIGLFGNPPTFYVDITNRSPKKCIIKAVRVHHGDNNYTWSLTLCEIESRNVSVDIEPKQIKKFMLQIYPPRFVVNRTVRVHKKKYEKNPSAFEMGNSPTTVYGLFRAISTQRNAWIEIDFDERKSQIFQRKKVAICFSLLLKKMSESQFNAILDKYRQRVISSIT